jgi:ferric iron reductase protein FhuF
MRNKFFVFSMFSLFIVGLLLVILIGITSQIGQAIPSDPYHINYYSTRNRLIGQVFYSCGEQDWGYSSDNRSNRIYNCNSSNPYKN